MPNLELTAPLNKIIRLNEDGSFKVLLIDGCLSEVKPDHAIELIHKGLYLKKEAGPGREIFLSFNEEFLLFSFDGAWNLSGNVKKFVEVLESFEFPETLPMNFKIMRTIRTD